MDIAPARTGGATSAAEMLQRARSCANCWCFSLAGTALGVCASNNQCLAWRCDWPGTGRIEARRTPGTCQMFELRIYTIVHYISSLIATVIPLSSSPSPFYTLPRPCCILAPSLYYSVMPDVPIRRSLPASPNAKIQKKQGAPKAKGSVRAKSGCYTCRIRRKVNPNAPILTSLLTHLHRSVTSKQTRTAAVPPAFVSDYNVSALAQSVPSGCGSVIFFHVFDVSMLTP